MVRKKTGIQSSDKRHGGKRRENERGKGGGGLNVLKRNVSKNMAQP